MIKDAIAALVEGESLSEHEAEMAMNEIMAGEATPAQFAAFATALRLKGETVDEIVGLARAMREGARAVRVDGPVIDTCGTGGDGASTFNISTVAAFVVAACGLRVAKHGNRAITSNCGSADLLEALGVRIDLPPEGVERCIESTGIGFMFAPLYHPAMRHVGPVRRELGIRTVFNLLGPLANPARASYQVVGVADRMLVKKMALVLRRLGCQRGFVVYGHDGLDEMTICGATTMCATGPASDAECTTLSPAEVGLTAAEPGALAGGSVERNVELALAVLRGERGPRRDAVLLNAAAALLAGGVVRTLVEGIELAAEGIDSGKALDRLDQLRKVSNECAAA